MELSDIKSSFSEKSDEELRELLMSIRQSRRTAKVNPQKQKKPKATRTAKAKPEVSLEALVANMSPEQIAAALAQLGGKK